MKIRETCSCGAKFQVEAPDKHATNIAAIWRAEHRCEPKAGERATVEAKDGGVFEIGFAATGEERA